MRIRGLIHSFSLDEQIVTIKYKKNINSFYFQRSLFKTFKSFLSVNEIIDLVSFDEPVEKNKRLVYQVMYVKELTLILPKKNKVFYDKDLICDSIKEFFKNLDYKLFIDTEMTMPQYHNDSSFVPELIQAGFFIVDSSNQVIEEYNYHIRPTMAKYVNKRTKTFLHLTSQIKKEEISYYKFYNKFKSLLNKYKPAVITFGKNDKLFLDSSYKVNKLPSLSNMSRFVNLSHIIKNYYELKNDPGLFNLYEYFYKDKREQTHDALDDAHVLHLVYDAFLKDIGD